MDYLEAHKNVLFHSVSVYLFNSLHRKRVKKKDVWFFAIFFFYKLVRLLDSRQTSATRSLLKAKRPLVLERYILPFYSKELHHASRKRRNERDSCLFFQFNNAFVFTTFPNRAPDKYLNSGIRRVACWTDYAKYDFSEFEAIDCMPTFDFTWNFLFYEGLKVCIQTQQVASPPPTLRRHQNTSDIKLVGYLTTFLKTAGSACWNWLVSCHRHSIRLRLELWGGRSRTL